LTQLKYLGLVATSISDGGLVHINAMHNLESLNVSNTKVTDTGLEHVKGLVKLKELYAMGTGVTEVGARRLHNVLPNCMIQYGAPPFSRVGGGVR
jgi:hypothetical protein